MAPLLRKADSGDLETVLSLENACFTDPWTPGMFKSALEGGSFEELYLLEDEGKCVGYVCIYIFDDEGEVMSVCVHPEKRRLGYGKILVDRALALMKERGVKDVFLEVRKSNSSALALYCGAGFTLIGERKKYYRHPTEDALVMKKSLKE